MLGGEAMAPRRRWIWRVLVPAAALVVPAPVQISLAQVPRGENVGVSFFADGAP